MTSLLALAACSALLPLAHAASTPTAAGHLTTGEHQVVIDGVHFW
jgi:hypothetical protein